jgi:polyhydroxyalkanoate synthesis regulator phasin
MADEKKKSDAQFDPAGIAEKAFLLGLGILEVTREKTSDLAADLIEKGKMSNSDAKKVADKIGEVAEESQEAMRKTVAAETKRAMKASGAVTRDDYQKLEAQIAELKEMLAAQAATPPAAGKSTDK